MSEVHLSYAGANESELQLYSYDAAGNRTKKTVKTDTGTILTQTLDDAAWAAADRINDLNQVKRRDEFDGTSTTTWRYEHDDNGNTTRMYRGSSGSPDEEWVYEWSVDGRLTAVKRNSINQIAYGYDDLGRLLTRTEYVLGVPQAPSRLEYVRLVR